jgi:phosphoribosylamine--glycine ligase
MADEGRPYRGVLYAGMMLTDDGPKVIEFNCRFGDPETQVVLPLLDPATDLLDVMDACVDGTLASVEPRWQEAAAVTVVMASAGYPTSSSEPVPIGGLDVAAAQPGCTVFHAGTEDVDGVPHTAGGRVLAVTAVAGDLADAAERAHAGVAAISFAGAQHRDDIARSTVPGAAGGRP